MRSAGMPQRSPSLLVLLALSACAAPPLAPPPAVDPAADTRQWFYSREGGRANLAYGTPQSDDIALSLRCAERSGRVTVDQGGLRPGQGISISSGGRSAVLRGRAQEDQLNGGVYMEAEADLAHPVLDAFRRTGALATRDGAEVLAATPAEHGQIQQFFAVCAR